MFRDEAVQTRSVLASTEEENKRLSEVVQHLEQQINLQAQQNVDAIDYRTQLHELKTKIEILNRELERSRILSDKLSEQVLKAQQKIDSSSTELHRALLAARGAFGTTELKRYGDSSTEMLELMWGELHNLIATLCSEVSQER